MEHYNTLHFHTVIRCANDENYAETFIIRLTAGARSNDTDEHCAANMT